MNRTQRGVAASAAYLVGIILFIFFFGRPFWDWATWNESRGTFDFGFVKVTTRPPFPSDAKAIVVGLILPILLAASGRIVSSGRE